MHVANLVMMEDAATAARSWLPGCVAVPEGSREFTPGWLEFVDARRGAGSFNCGDECSDE